MFLAKAHINYYIIHFGYFMKKYVMSLNIYEDFVMINNFGVKNVYLLHLPVESQARIKTFREKSGFNINK